MLLLTILLTGCSGVFSATPTGSALPSATMKGEATHAVVEPSTTPTGTLAPTQLPSPEPTMQGCTEEHGQVTRTLFQSELMGEGYEVSIYTPPCYDQTTNTDYPVLYLMHGQNQDDTYWFSLGVAGLVGEKIRAGAPPFIMVSPREVHNFDPISETRFPDSVVRELVPWIDTQYQTCPIRSCRAIGGISRGGGWAIRLAMRNFNVFGSVGAHSMGLMEGDWWQTQKNLETHSALEFPRIYIDQGVEDGLKEDTDYFVRILRTNGIPYEYHQNPGNHDKKYWLAHIEEYIDWYIRGWE